MIELKNIQKRFNDGFEAIHDLNLTCEEEEITVLIGPSGCGKTTTLEMLNRLIDPTKGSIYIDDRDTSKISPVQLRREIGYVIQHVGLFPHMTIAANVEVVPRLLKWDKDHIKQKTKELMDLVGLDQETFGSRYPSELSGGQQQRIGVIRALAAEPSIILMDEPFSALDPISREQLQNELIHLQKEIQKTIVFVTHDMDEALKIADKIILMKDGEVIQQDSPENILRYPANQFVEDFIGQKRLKQVQNIPTVNEIMVKPPIETSLERGLASSMKMMENKQVDTLVVVDNEKLKGYISIFDVLNNYQDETKRVRDIFHSFEHIVDPETLLSEAVTIMNDNNLSYLPVVKDDNDLVGLITKGSIVGHMEDVYPTPASGGI